MSNSSDLNILAGSNFEASILFLDANAEADSNIALSMLSGGVRQTSAPGSNTVNFTFLESAAGVFKVKLSSADRSLITYSTGYYEIVIDTGGGNGQQIIKTGVFNNTAQDPLYPVGFLWATFDPNFTITTSQGPATVILGASGAGIHHTRLTGQSGQTDTYTMYADAAETHVLGTFTHANGTQSLSIDDLVDVVYSNNNLFLGPNSGNATLTGSHNLARGYNALISVGIGNYNIADGFRVLEKNTTGVGNTGRGALALHENISGEYNKADGFRSLRLNISGSYNIGDGFESLITNTTGSKNIGIGYKANCPLPDQDNQINIGNTFYKHHDNTTSKIRLKNLGGAGFDVIESTSDYHDLYGHVRLKNGALHRTAMSEPANPLNNESVEWLSNGTGAGNAGDLMRKVTISNVTHTLTISAY